MRKSFVFIGFAIALITIARSGWAQGGSGACDRACLESLVDNHDRRYVVVDRERGLVFSFAFFDHARCCSELRTE